MKSNTLVKSFLFIALATTSISAAAEESIDVKIARAISAAQPAISANASVHDVDGKVLKQGVNDWVCMPGIGPGDDHPMCNDEVWTKLMHAASMKAEFKTDRIGISYMMQGDAKVSNADPYATDPNNGDVWVQEGPHLMIVGPKEILEGVSDNPLNGGPYVMWKDTDYAHIMAPVVMPQ